MGITGSNTSLTRPAHVRFRPVNFCVVLAGLFFLAGLPLASARSVAITLIHTTDLHGHIRPTVDYDGNGDLGGILRCASKIEAIRKEKPGALLIDCGDSFQGSPESYLSEGHLIIDAFNELNYDAWILGNHEFDWGTALLRDRHDQVNVPFLAANLYFLENENNWLPKIKPYVMRDVEGVKVAIIGLVTPGIPRWSGPHLLNHAMFEDSTSCLQKIWPEVMSEEPDVIIVAAHQGHKHRGDDFANQINAIAQAFPQVDLIVGGHTHQPVEEMRYGNVHYTQAGYHGIWLGEVDLAYDTVTRRVENITSRLHLMNADVPFHEGLLSRWSETLAKADEQLTHVIGVVTNGLSAKPDRHGCSSMQQFISASIYEGVDTDFVLHGSLSDEEIPAGPMTYRDVWKIVPYENTIGILSLTPSQIRDVLEENFSRRLYHYALGPYGFAFDLEYEDDVPKVMALRDHAGNPLHARKKYRVAFNSYVLSSGGERYMKVQELSETPEGRLEMLPFDTRALVVQQLKRNMSQMEKKAGDDE